jgi:alpha-galactosidase
MKFFFDSSTGTMNFNDDRMHSFGIRNAVFSFQYQVGKEQFQEFSNQLNFSQIAEEVIDHPVFGQSNTLKFMATSLYAGNTYHLETLVPVENEVVLWKLAIINEDTEIRVRKMTLLDCAGNPQGTFQYKGKRNDLRFFSQGWQSWSHTASYGVNDRMISSKLGFIQNPLCYDAGTPRYKQKGKFSSDFFTVISDSSNGEGLLLGFLTQQQQFGAISLDMNQLNSLQMWASTDGVILEAGKTLDTDWALLKFVSLEEQPLQEYSKWVKKTHGIGKAPETHAGWCSWYYFYQNISNPIIRENLSQIVDLQEKLPLHLVQIDDGYQKQVGDWLKNAPVFPEGVGPLCESIKQNNLMPGLWMAPFIVHPESDLMQEHPEWILRSKNGKPVNAGFIWNVFTTALDITNPEALAYAAQVVKEASQKWGYPYLKLDFLYAAALPGERYDKTLTRAQILRKGYEAIREAVGPDVYLLGCGAPIGTSIGIFDAMRIGADVSGNWVPKYFGVEFPFKNEPNMPAARNAIQNVLTRQYMHRNWWINDPDCLLVRPDSELTLTEVQTLTSVIGLSGGAFLVSDNMPALPKERIELIQKVMPIHKYDVQILDLFEKQVPEKVKVNCKNKSGEWHVLARYHWLDKPGPVQFNLEDYKLPIGKYWVRSFWEDKIDLVDSSDPLIFSVEPHASIVLAVRPYHESEATYLGSNLHILQGIELNKFVSIDGMDKFNLELNQKMKGTVDLYLPGNVKKILVDEKKSNWDEIAKNIYRVHVKGIGKIKIRVVYKREES